MFDQNSEGTTVRYLNGLGIDNKLRMQVGTTVSYLLSDHLGSTTAQTDATGNITNTASYDGFGNATGNLNTRYQFTGREFDADLGLQYSRARFYDAKLGRFISEDPIGFGGGGVNQFAYTSNNAVNATDPSGLYEIDVHYYLTYYLVKKSGCFSRSQTAAIANGNQLTDEDSNYSPGFGKVFQNSTYHALNDNAEEGVGSRDLRLLSAYPTANFLEFGRYLHYFQDTFSHSGFHSPTYGHGASGHTVDKTASDVEKAMRMSRQTYEEISRFAAEECNCKAKNWNKSIEDTAKAFAGVPIDHDPYYFDIAGEGLPGMPALAEYASPGALNKKITILGVPYR